MRRIVSIWFPEFAVERFIRSRMKIQKPPPSRHLPFALVETGPRGMRLAAVNAAARGFGLLPGQRLADARAAVPDLICELHEPGEDMTSLLGLCRWLERYSPWAAPDPPDGALLDATGVAHLFGGETEMLAGLARRLAAYGFTVRTAAAETVGAAWALARYDKGPPALPGEERKRFETLPVEALRIDPGAAGTLRRLGLKTVGSLLDIPRPSLARRFRGETVPENVLIRLDEALGHRDEPLNPLNPPTVFIAHRVLIEPLVSHDGLETVLTGLAGTLARDLERASRGATRLILKLFRSDGSRVSLPAGFSIPSHDPRHLLRILKPKLEPVDAGFGIDAMTLEARETGPTTTQQYGFAEDDRSQDLEQLNDRVANRHGGALFALEAIESHIPERAEKATAPTLARHDKRTKKSQPAAIATTTQPPAEAEGGRPLLIFEYPEPAVVIAAVPDGPPMRFTWRRVTRRVVRARGPERIAPEWWRLAAGERPRDYYAVEDDQGRRYWLYREGLYGETGEAQPKWFVHGLSP